MFPDVPAGSIIEQRETAAGVTLAWRLPGGDSSRFFSAAFILFWLCLWTFGGAMAALFLVTGAWGWAKLFLLAWLGLWAVGEVTAVCSLWALLRPPRPESVTLGAEAFRYDPGYLPTAESADGRGAQPGSSLRWPGHWPARRSVIEVARDEVKEFVLERVGERQRLCFDHGADRVEIGPCLREPEREWLWAVLESWRQGRPS
jgi:hypothetical protein